MPLISMLFYKAPTSQGWGNRKYSTRTVTRASEFSQGGYSFQDDGDWPGPGKKTKNSYGTHDWIADSAIRLIMMDATWRSKVEWMFVSIGPTNYKEFKVSLTDPTGHWTTAPLAWRESTAYPDYVLRYYTIDGKTLWNDESAWLRYRRYINYLHGTTTPDVIHWGNYRKTFGQRIIIEGDWVQTEEMVPTRYISEWKHTSNQGHHLTYRVIDFGGENLCVVEDLIALYFIRDAVKDAVEYLTTDYEYRSKSNPDAPPSIFRGKYEAAAQALGGMVHLISDLAHPGHVCKPYSYFDESLEAAWNNYANYRTKFTSGEGASFPNGGPDWSHADIGDPSTIINANYPLKPIDPEDAAFLMSETAFGAIDLYPDTNYTETPLESRPQAGWWFPKTTTEDVEIIEGEPKVSHTVYQQRCAKLLHFAVYYSACAILGVLKDINIPQDHDQGRVNDDLVFQSPEPAITIGYPVENLVPQHVGDIVPVEQADPQKRTTDYTGKMNLMFALSTLVPLLALVVLPQVASNAIKTESPVAEKVTAD